MQSSFPIYILRLGTEEQVIISPDQIDIGHIEFWEETVAGIVAAHYQLPVKKLINLPYCQRRARVYGNRLYYGEKQDPALLALVQRALGNDDLVFFYDEHERRLEEGGVRRMGKK